MKMGLEIHQRLDTHKLFCNCSSAAVEKAGRQPDSVITRKLHPVFSELGEIDDASKAEFSKGRVFKYQSFSENDCLVEMDEEPPHQLNPDALRICLEMAAHLDARPVDELHVMRKLVIDGSNTAGFQRTAIVAMNGGIDTSAGRVGIPLIALEEESAGIILSSDSEATYSLDRLGIPLIEISTEPTIKDGKHLREVAEKLGMMLRATGKVARGLGTIRQDVNISTEGGARVEIKGAQDLKMLPEMARLEVDRQTELVKLMHELRIRKAYGHACEPADLSKIFARTESPLVSKGMGAGATVMGIRLQSHAGILGTELQPGRRYGSELSDYAKAAGVKGIIHSDEDLSKYKISPHEAAVVMKALGMSEADAFVLVVAPERQALAALANVVTRAAMDYVPEETRKANPDGTSSYMRPLPGKGRLYPETDVPPIRISPEMLGEVRASTGESLENKEKKLAKMLNPEMARKILRSRHLKLFEKLVENGADPMLAAVTIEDTVVSLRRDGVEFADMDKSLADLFSEYSKGTFVKAAIPDVLRHMAKCARADAVLAVYRLHRISGKQLAEIAAQEQFDVKRIMQKYRLQVDPAELLDVIRKHGKKG